MKHLNPWSIEIVYHERERIRLNICSDATGEIRQITLGVDEIFAISVLENVRILKAAEIVDSSDERSEHLDSLLGCTTEEARP